MSDQNKYSGPVSDGLSPLERVLEQLEIERGAAKIALEIAAQHIRNLEEQLETAQDALRQIRAAAMGYPHPALMRVESLASRTLASSPGELS